MNRIVFLLLSVALPTTADPGSGTKAGTGIAPGCVVNNGSGKLVETIPSPSLLELLVHPEQYDGCMVTVQGFFQMRSFTTGQLLLSTEDERGRGSLFGTIPLALKDGPAKITNAVIKRAEGKMVFVQGRFFATSMKTGAAHIGNIERFKIPFRPGDKQ
ncbi:MAG: hypothetical protein ACM3PC_06805 [Deltaproteobacteria bacterium]